MVVIFTCISVKLLPLCVVKSGHRRERAREILYTAVSERLVQLLLGPFVVNSAERNIILLVVLVLGSCFKNNGHSRRSQVQPFAATLGATRYLLWFIFMLSLKCS